MGFRLGEMPGLDMHVGDTVETSLLDHFSDPECLRNYPGRGIWPIWAVQSSDPAAVAISVSDSTHVLTTVALAVADSVRVTVGHINQLDVSDTLPPHEFLVRVRPHPSER